MYFAVRISHLFVVFQNACIPGRFKRSQIVQDRARNTLVVWRNDLEHGNLANQIPNTCSVYNKKLRITSSTQCNCDLTTSVFAYLGAILEIHFITIVFLRVVWSCHHDAPRAAESLDAVRLHRTTQRYVREQECPSEVVTQIQLIQLDFLPFFDVEIYSVDFRYSWHLLHMELELFEKIETPGYCCWLKLWRLIRQICKQWLRSNTNKETFFQS